MWAISFMHLSGGWKMEKIYSEDDRRYCSSRNILFFSFLQDIIWFSLAIGAPLCDTSYITSYVVLPS